MEPLSFPHSPDMSHHPSSDSDDAVLRELGSLGPHAHVSFQGLRRMSGLHQQALARALRRLERGGAVDHDGAGYSLSAAGARTPNIARSPNRAFGPSLATLLVPPDRDPRALVDALRGTWSRNRHWYGELPDDVPGGPALIWSTVPDEDLLRARLDGCVFSLEATGNSLPWPAVQEVLAVAARTRLHRDATAHSCWGARGGCCAA